MTERIDPQYPHVGVGWKFPVRFDEHGVVERSVDEEHVVEAMRILLRTGQGSRAMRPEFGAGVDRYVFGSRTTDACFQLATDVRRALMLSEPRVLIDRVEATPSLEDDARIDVLLEFRLDRHRRPSSLVLPYYVDGSVQPA